MGFFDFLKKRNNEKATSFSIDENSFSLEVLKDKLLSLGYNVEVNSAYLALTVNSDLEIALAVVTPTNAHPSLIQLMIIAIHPIYFPKGIVENVAGVGSNLETKIDSALDNYLQTTFNPIIESFSENHIPEMDFTAKNVLWHPNLGDIIYQGQWKEFPMGEPLFEILKEKIKDKLSDQKFNWLKMYISKNSDDEIIGECLFNNEPWEEGLAILTEYSKNWNGKVEYFLAQKQFIMFRRCDKFDK
ncbi:DUF6348 family protein [Flavobacterium nitrogenifigens]|uniref:DUF6348 family protein n=1 Tax=Flavobacterium nitrogenifigens TaxID=1617283 RepID=UPI0031AFCE07